jgi:hypothetical protein
MTTLAKKYWVFALRHHICGIGDNDAALKVLSEMYGMKGRCEDTGYYFLLERSGLCIWHPYDDSYLDESDNIDNVLDSISDMAHGLSLLEDASSEYWDPYDNT